MITSSVYWFKSEQKDWSRWIRMKSKSDYKIASSDFMSWSDELVRLGVKWGACYSIFTFCPCIIWEIIDCHSFYPSSISF